MNFRNRGGSKNWEKSKTNKTIGVEDSPLRKNSKLRGYCVQKSKERRGEFLLRLKNDGRGNNRCQPLMTFRYVLEQRPKENKCLRKEAGRP